METTDNCCHKISTEPGKCQGNWKYWLRPLGFLLLFIVAIVIIPWLISDLIKNQGKAFAACYSITGIICVGTFLASFNSISHHVINYLQPELQKPILVITLFVPVYALESWLVTLVPRYAIYFGLFRQIYGAFVVYNFMAYILNFLTQEHELSATLANKPQVKHIFPLWCFLHWPMGGIFILRCQQGVYQYSFVRSLTTVLQLICTFSGIYHLYSFNLHYGWIWITVICICSQIYTTYCLWMFYQAAKEELQLMGPLIKFISVVLIVFSTLWQEVIVAAIVNKIQMKVEWGWETKAQLSSSIQASLVCLEMLIFAVLYNFVFSYKHFTTHNYNIPWYQSIKNILDVTPTRSDITKQFIKAGDRFRQSFSNTRDQPSNNQSSLYSSSSIEDDDMDVDESSNLITPYFDSEMANVMGYGCNALKNFRLQVENNK